MANLTIPQALEMAVQHRQAGRLNDAESICAQIIQVVPQQAEALHLLGVVAAQKGQHDRALECIGKAIALQPASAEFYSNHGIVLHQMGRVAEAEAAFRESIRLGPQFSTAYANLGGLLEQQNRLDEAIVCLRRALEVLPRNGAALSSLGQVLWRQGRLDEATACLQSAVACDPTNPDPHNNLGNVLLDLGKLAEAIAEFQEALRLKPDFTLAYLNLANVLRQQGKCQEALALVERARRLEPDNPRVHNSLGSLLLEQGQVDDALRSIQHALRLKPDHPNTHINLGLVYKSLRKFDEAIASHRHALHLKPDFSEAYVCLGNVRMDQERFEEAAEEYRQALSLRPNSFDAHSNLGATLQIQGKLTEALTHYDHAIRLRPDFGDARWNRSLALLLQGNFECGWPEYEWRWKTKNQQERPFRKPRWDGAPLAGRTILLHAEQGMGDAFQFIRYAPLVKARGGRVIVECHKPLVKILAGVQGVDQLIARGEPLPDFDVHLPMLSVPGVFRTNLTNIPLAIPYLTARPDLVEHWRQEFSAIAGFKVGIAWQGSPTNKDDRRRSIPLVHYAPLAGVPGVKLISLQKGLGADQLRDVAFTVIDLGTRLDEANGSFMDTAAVMKNLDLVITSDTSTAHLAGALGVPVWVALCYSAEWRWLRERADSPWYPSMRLFRQKKAGDWAEVFEGIGGALRDTLGRGTHAPPTIRMQIAGGGTADVPLLQALEIAIQQQGAGRLQEAEKICQHLVRLDPRLAGALQLLGVIAAQKGQQARAAEWFGQALAIEPNNAEFLGNAGIVYHELGRNAEAEAAFRRAIELEPKFSTAHANLGTLLERQDRLEDAIVCLQGAIEMDPRNAAAHTCLGQVLYKQGRLEEAIVCHHKALACAPGYAEAHNPMGIALLGQGKPDEAAAVFQEALRLKPHFADARNNLGNALKELSKLGEAMDCYRQSLELQPNGPDAHSNLGLAYLSLGDFERGWPEYEWRFKRRDTPRRQFRQPQWDGSSLHGRTILLHAEQGLGDTLQFIRVAPLVKARGGRVVMECQKPLQALLAGCRGIDQLIGVGTRLPDFDVQAPLLSLGAILKINLETIPTDVPYIFADPGLVEKWGREVSTMSGFKVGITWQGNTAHKKDRLRSIPLAHFAALAQVPGVHLISLQKGFGTEQIQQVAGRFAVTDLGSRLDETGGAFMDTAAVMKHLDLVITSDTSTAHLAGALGVPVWVALPIVPDWRWLLERSDNPWYPSMRLFRQAERGNWAGVFERIAAALAELSRGRTGSFTVTVDVAPGELIDKITILQIKSDRITDAGKLDNVRIELALLTEASRRALPPSAELDALTAELKAVNEQLWDIEDAIRLCEREDDFGPRFIELARSVYRSNDQRAALKRRLNELLGSTIVEEKSYADY